MNQAVQSLLTFFWLENYWLTDNSILVASYFYRLFPFFLVFIGSLKKPDVLGGDMFFSYP